MKYIFLPLIFVALLFSGCKKEGLDGKATLIVRPWHHEDAIVSTAAYRDSVFIKFDATEIPLDAIHDYDALVVGEIGVHEIRVEHPCKGNYSVYCTGWDPAFNARVSGGTTIEIRNKDRKDEIVVDVLVVE